MDKRKQPIPEDARDRKILADIKRVGWAVMGINAEENFPTYSFSIGIYRTLGQPEIIMMGLNPVAAARFINMIGDRMKKGERVEPGRKYDDLAEGFLSTFVAVDRRYYKSFLGYAGWYNCDWNFPVLQCVWPDKKGIFPWEEGFESRFFFNQRILGSVDRWPHGWIFADPPNLSCFSMKQIVHGKAPLLQVSHDEDGSWQFLTGEKCTLDNALLASLESMALHDEALIELADLPCGWRAKRNMIGGNWIRKRTS
jgi:hypothetical protein